MPAAYEDEIALLLVHGIFTCSEWITQKTPKPR